MRNALGCGHPKASLVLPLSWPCYQPSNHRVTKKDLIGGLEMDGILCHSAEGKIRDSFSITKQVREKKKKKQHLNLMPNTPTNIWLQAFRATGAASASSLPFQKQGQCLLLPLHCWQNSPFRPSSPKHTLLQKELKPSLSYIKLSRATWQEVIIQEQPLNFSTLHLWRGILFVPKKIKSKSRSLGQYHVYLHAAKTHKQEFREQHWIDAVPASCRGDTP